MQIPVRHEQGQLCLQGKHLDPVNTAKTPDFHHVVQRVFSSEEEEVQFTGGGQRRMHMCV